MGKDLVSIIVPVYNSEKVLNKCIESLIKQTYSCLDIILIDDGSSDSSGSMCDKFAASDSRIKVIHKKNEGAGVARNIGIQNAKGEWIIFVDSDDFVSVKLVEKTLSVAKKKNADIVFFGAFNRFDKRRHLLYQMMKVRPISGFAALRNLLLGKLTSNTWGWIVKNDDYLKKKIYFKSYPIAEDLELLTRLLPAVKKVTAVPEVLYQYNIENMHSMTYCPTDETIAEWTKAEQELSANVLLSFPDYRKYVNNNLVRFYYTIYMYHRKLGQDISPRGFIDEDMYAFLSSHKRDLSFHILKKIFTLNLFNLSSWIALFKEVNRK